MFSKQKIALIASAPIADPLLIKDKITAFPSLIAVDGGANYCFSLGINPDLLVGDFDSIHPEVLTHYVGIPQKHFPRDKDQTDLEIAIELAFQAHAEELTVFGALQGRTDHALGNLMLLTRYPGKLFFESDSERLFCVDRKVTLATIPGQQISLIPINGPVRKVHTMGLKWELDGKTLDKQFLSLSNEAIGSEITISLQEGDLLCCLNHPIL